MAFYGWFTDIPSRTLHELFVNTSFNEEELTVVWQTINVEHRYRVLFLLIQELPQ
jgi:hypothetical protein